MRVVQVDERTSSWEDDHPVFRVYLHGPAGAAATTSDGDGVGVWTDTYDITGADVLQVVDWAQRQGGGRLRWAVALVGRQPDEGSGSRTGLTWLIGRDGADAPVDAAEHDTLDRMRARVHAPVVVPEADRAPDGVGDAYA